MDIIIESTKKFESDIKKIDKPSKSKLIAKINNLSEHLQSNQEKHKDLYKLKKIDLGASLEDSMYIYKIGTKLRIILSIESDPLFDNINMTLYRCVKPDNLDKAFKSIIQSIYQFELNKEVDNV